jgi:acylpyruvate hydrolase
MKQLKIKESQQAYDIGKLVCVGRNYAAHAKELGNDVPKEPMLFLKTSSCIINSGEEVVHPAYSDNLHYEVELVLLIGKTLKNADDKSAKKAIAGYGVGLDMTLRDLQNELKAKGKPWTTAKVFDTSAVLGDFISSNEDVLNGDERIWLSVNGEMKQNSFLKNMIFDISTLVKFISSRMTLEPGDLIFTGTPEGVGRVVRGDKLEGGIQNIGKVTTVIK